MGVVPIGLLGVLLRAKQTGAVRSVAPLIDRLVVEMKFRVSSDIRRKVLELAGE